MFEVDPNGRVSLEIENQKDRLRSLWDENKNGIPFSTDLKRGTPYWWRCPKSPKHSFSRTIAKQLDAGCPICSGHYFRNHPGGFKLWCELNEREDLLSQWSPKNSIFPDQIHVSSRQKVWWKCKFGHEWKQYPNARTTRGCPSCGGKRLELGLNDLLSFCEDNPRFHHLIFEWDSEKNPPMNTFTKRSGKRVWWKCSNGHSWKAYVSNRTNGDCCGKCGESGVEKEIRAELEKLFQQKSTSDRSVLSGKEVDIYFEKSSIGFEVNGDYWHGKRFNENNEEQHRTKFLNASKARVLLLFVWESDWKQRKEAVLSAVKRLLKDPEDIDPILQIFTKD